MHDVRVGTTLRRLGLLTLLVFSCDARAACPGDCNRDGLVTVAEIDSAVEILLGRAQAATCSGLDRALDGTRASDVVAAASHRRSGCPPDEQLVGQVADVDSGLPLAGVAVKLSGGLVAFTDANGFYGFGGLEPGSVVAGFSKDGYANNSRQLDILPGKFFVAGVLLKAAAPPQPFDASAGASVATGAATVVIPAGALAKLDGTPVTGDAALVVTPGGAGTDGLLAFPGSFDDAVDIDGKLVALETLGFATYELTQGGEPVDLAEGQRARIEFVLPDDAQGKFDGGETIPLWGLDEDTARWVQQPEPGVVGVASDGSGKLSWVAEVPHFSSWACGAAISETSCITGVVLHDGQPVASATVTAVGTSYSGTSSGFTDEAGLFCFDVKRGATLQVEVRPNGSAEPALSQAVALPDTASDCAAGGCHDIGTLPMAFEACVHGVVTDVYGNPMAQEAVTLVPGESVVTDANGEYCAAAAVGQTVFVLAAGHPTATVASSTTADCGAPSGCARVDLSVSPPDTDGDGAHDLVDNCVGVPNPAQADCDADGRGDACSPRDCDADGVQDEADNCPAISNASQANADGDRDGDACDPCTDSDGDGFGNAGHAANTCVVDNCAVIENPDQEDTNADGVGDACDFLWGDVAPRGAPDGVVDSADVALIYDFILGVQVATADEFLRANVSPATFVGSVATPTRALPRVVSTPDRILVERVAQGLYTFAVPR